MHEHTIQLSTLDIPDLNGFVSPAHNLSIWYVSNRRGQLSPLEHNILDQMAVSVTVDTFIVVAEEQMHPAWVR